MMDDIHKVIVHKCYLVIYHICKFLLFSKNSGWDDRYTYVLIYTFIKGY